MSLPRLTVDGTPGRIRIPPVAAFRLRLNRRPESTYARTKTGVEPIVLPRLIVDGTPGRIRTCDLRIRSPLLYPTELQAHKSGNRSKGCKVRCASNHLIVSVYRVPQMQGVGHADVHLYFKCPTTKQMRCPVNTYQVHRVVNTRHR